MHVPDHSRNGLPRLGGEAAANGSAEEKGRWMEESWVWCSSDATTTTKKKHEVDPEWKKKSFLYRYRRVGSPVEGNGYPYRSHDRLVWMRSEENKMLPQKANARHVSRWLPWWRGWTSCSPPHARRRMTKKGRPPNALQRAAFSLSAPLPRPPSRKVHVRLPS